MKLKDTTVIIPYADGRLPLDVIRCLGYEGVEFILISREPQNSAQKSRYCKQFICSETIDDASLIALLFQIKNTGSKEIILPATTEGFLFASKNRALLSERFDLPPLATHENLVTASDKWKLFDLAIQNDLPVLPSESLTQSTIADIRDNKSNITLPALVKSRAKEGGAGFRKVDTVEELSDYYEQLGEKAESDYFIQPYVDSKDHSLSVYCEDGEIKCHMLWKAVLSGKNPYAIPLSIQFTQHEEVLKIGNKLLKLMNWQGVCDVDFIVDNQTGKPWLLEINARFWGNIGANAAEGINFPLLMCNAAQSSQIEDWPIQKDGTLFCYPRGIAKLIKDPEHRFFTLIKKPLKTTGLIGILRDPFPEFYRVYLRYKEILTRSQK